MPDNIQHEITPARKFNWGRVVEDTTVGPYTIREYIDKKNGETLFHGYIDGQDQFESWDSLDDALAGLIVRRHLGPNNSPVNYTFIAGLRAQAEHKVS